MRIFLYLFCLVAALSPLAAAAQRCGTPEGTCPTANGFYRLVLPEGAEGPVPALAFLHGWGGSSSGVMKNAERLAALSERGFALIAPEGVVSADGKNSDWAVRDGFAYDRDDIAFLAEAFDDAAGHGVDRRRILLAGFSRGGSMVWDVACHGPSTARAYAPVAGAFWEPVPEHCAGPVDLFHTHGWTDRVVPLEGRAVFDGKLVQGDAFVSMHILRETLGCDPHMPDSAPVAADSAVWLRHWDHCPEGRMDLMLHPGGHTVPPGWLGRALDWFEARLAE